MILNRESSPALMNTDYDRFRIASIVLALVLGHFVVSLRGASAIDEARDAVSRWVEVESSLSAEALAWEEKKSLLSDLVAVAEAEIASMKTQLSEAETATNLAEARRTDLVAKRDENLRLSSKVMSFLEGVEGQLRSFVPRMPFALREKLTPLMQRLPQNSQETELGVAARMQTVMGIITEVQRFDMLVTTGEEIIEGSDGSRREVKTIHFGLGAAYYVSGDGTEAGTGASSGDGWVWESSPNLAGAIKEAIGLAEGNLMEARFLALPVSTQSEDQ